MYLAVNFRTNRYRGIVQQRILEELTATADSIEEIDMDAAVGLVVSRLPPLPANTDADARHA